MKSPVNVTTENNFDCLLVDVLSIELTLISIYHLHDLNGIVEGEIGALTDQVEFPHEIFTQNGDGSIQGCSLTSQDL